MAMRAARQTHTTLSPPAQTQLKLLARRPLLHSGRRFQLNGWPLCSLSSEPRARKQASKPLRWWPQQQPKPQPAASTRYKTQTARCQEEASKTACRAAESGAPVEYQLVVCAVGCAQKRTNAHTHTRTLAHRKAAKELSAPAQVEPLFVARKTSVGAEKRAQKSSSSTLIKSDLRGARRLMKEGLQITTAAAAVGCQIGESGAPKA